MDVIFTEIARTIVEWVEERFGRAAAWLVAIGSIVMLTIGIVAAAIHLLG